jgi:hypothetical protein
MRDRAPVIALRSVLIAAAILLTSIRGIHAAGRPAEVRALWVVWSTLSSPASIATMVGAARDGGFSTLLVQVAARGGASAAGTSVGLASALSERDIVATVQAARRLGARGVILFSYDGLTGPSRGTEYLSQVGRAAFMQ